MRPASASHDRHNDDADDDASGGGGCGDAGGGSGEEEDERVKCWSCGEESEMLVLAGDFSSSQVANLTHSSCKDSIEQRNEVDDSRVMRAELASSTRLRVRREGVSEHMDTPSAVVMTEDRIKSTTILL